MELSSKIAKRFNLQFEGADQIVKRIGNPAFPSQNNLFWVDSLLNANKITCGVIICPNSFVVERQPNLTILKTTDSPRLVFSKIVNKFFPELFIDSLINYSDFHKKRSNITVGEYCYIGKNVTIGSGSIIHPNTTIYSNTVIGERCVIMSNSSIGTTGIGFEREGETMYKFPQIGNVVIGNDVEIGPNCTIRRGALGSTILKDNVKIGSLTNIGHNCVINDRVLITGSTCIAGSSIIENDVFIGVNVSIKNKVIVGSNATIGMGSVVIEDIPEGEIWMGIPAKKK